MSIRRRADWTSAFQHSVKRLYRNIDLTRDMHLHVNAMRPQSGPCSSRSPRRLSNTDRTGVFCQFMCPCSLIERMRDSGIATAIQACSRPTTDHDDPPAVEDIQFGVHRSWKVNYQACSRPS
jgi:hypothetical protein